MYRPIPALELAIAAAEEPGGAVMRDRRRFVPFFRAAEEYAHKEGMVIGGTAATLLLLKAPLGPSDFFYEMYSGNALADARALTDLAYSLDPVGLGHYAAMTTRVPQKEFEISVEERPLFCVKALAVHRGARAADIIVPSLRPANFAKDKESNPLMLQCMGPEIQLIDVYAALSDPSRASDWGALVGVEERLRGLFTEEIQNKITEATSERGAKGGAAAHSGPKGARDFVAALLREYVPRTGHALIGSLAVAALSAGTPGCATGRLQIVTANTFNDEEKAVARIANRLGYSVQSVRNEPRVPTDDRLQRMTMYITRPGECREPFLDVYNAGNYQLVGHTNAKPGGKAKLRRQQEALPAKAGLERVPVGTPFTVLRFLLVDAWTIQLLFRMQVTSAQYTRQVLRGIVADYAATAKAYLAARDAGAFKAIFPDDYIGRFQDPTVYAKRERHRGAASKERGRAYYPPYYPARKDAARS